MLNRPSKGYYTESEAAAALGISIDALRALVKTEIVHDQDSPHVASNNYQPSELLTLRLILGGMRVPEAQVAPQAEATL